MPGKVWIGALERLRGRERPGGDGKNEEWMGQGHRSVGKNWIHSLLENMEFKTLKSLLFLPLMPNLIATVAIGVSPRVLPGLNLQSSAEWVGVRVGWECADYAMRKVGWQGILCHWEVEMACMSASAKGTGVADFNLSSNFQIKIWSRYF